MLERVSNTASWLIVVAALAFGYCVVDKSWYDIFPFHIINSVEILTPTVKQGEPVRLRANITRTKICKPTVIRIFRHQGNDQVYKLSSNPAAISGLGQHKVVSFPVPETADFPVGCYAVTGYVANDCGNRVYTVVLPEYEFCVVPK